MSEMSYQERIALLRYVAESVAKDPSLMRDVMSAMTEGLQNKLDQVNQMRVDAEVSVCWLLDKVPKSALTKEPGMMVKAKKVVVNSGMFSGTVHAQTLAKEIMVGEEMEKQHDEDYKRQAKEEQMAQDQKLRDDREKNRQRKNPVSTIPAEDVAVSVATGNSTLTPFRIANGKGPYSLHGWVLVVNEKNPTKAQERSYLYVGIGARGRDCYATEELAVAAVAKITKMGEDKMRNEP